MHDAGRTGRALATECIRVKMMAAAPTGWGACRVRVLGSHRLNLNPSRCPTRTRKGLPQSQNSDSPAPGPEGATAAAPNWPAASPWPRAGPRLRHGPEPARLAIGPRDHRGRRCSRHAGSRRCRHALSDCLTCAERCVAHRMAEDADTQDDDTHRMHVLCPTHMSTFRNRLCQSRLDLVLLA